MNKMYSYNKFIIFVVVLLLSLSAFSNIGDSSSGVHQDDNDGWWTDTFQNETYVDLTNCVVSKGNIMLNPNASPEKSYNFSTWRTSDNKAYYYTPSFFISLLTISPSISVYKEKELSRYWGDYDLIAERDYNYFTTTTTNKLAVHHFRFKITQDTNFMTQLDIHWYGKSLNSQMVTMYYWQPLGNLPLGTWEKADTSKNKTAIELQRSYTGDLPVEKDNYIDICVVATPARGLECTLSSDYVSVTTHTKGYSSTGTAISKPIDPKNNVSMWEMFTWVDNIKKDTSIKYHILYGNESGYYSLIEDKYLDGSGSNIVGFTNPPIYLQLLPVDKYKKLKIEADLETSDQSVSPEILSWSITWQTKENMWRDLFNSSLRIDDDMSNKINVGDGKAVLIPLINNWAMFGQNPANTRSSDGSGPRSKPHPYWMSPEGEGYKVGSKYVNPVIKDGILYIPSSDGKTIYKFNTIYSGGGLYNYPDQSKQGKIPEYAVMGSPAVTDNLVVVATGNTSNGGVENKLYAFNKNSLEKEWAFGYENEETGNNKICYYGSPVVSNNKIFISSWSGDESVLGSIAGFLNLTKGNNKIIALELTGDGINLNKMAWDYSLPAGSFCSPAVYGDNVVVGCANIKPNKDSLFCLDTNGKYKWSVNVGSIGRASPVIYDNKVFVIVKKLVDSPIKARAEIVALRLDDGSKLWNYSISDPMFNIYNLDFAACTPAINSKSNIIYVASSDGILYAFGINDGTLVNGWPIKIYTKGIFSPQLMISSPAYAYDRVYIGTPDKIIYGIDTSNAKVAWSVPTRYPSAAVLSSPIVADGLLFFTDENKRLYCLGYPSEEQQIEGSLFSIPIHLQKNHSWDRFYADSSPSQGASIWFSILDEQGNILQSNVATGDSIHTEKVKNKDVIRLRADFTTLTSADSAILYDWSVTTTTGGSNVTTVFDENSFNFTDTPPLICRINVQDQKLGLWNTSAGYYLKYKNQSIIRTLDGIAQCPCENGSTNKTTLEVNISDIDILKDNNSGLELSKNITLLSIRFNIKNSAGNITYSKWHKFKPPADQDNEKPIFYDDSFKPKGDWTNTTTPICSIDVRDIGTGSNTTGLNIGSAKFTLEYEDQSGIKTSTGIAQCTGYNGSKNRETISIDISKLDFSGNITELNQIRFYIEDLAETPNSNYSKWHEFKTDAEKPYSYINNTENITYKTNTTPVEITAVAYDNISGVDYVMLYYRALNSSSWVSFSSDDQYPYSWSFSVASGEYELCTIATDLAGNIEDFPDQGDISFVFDPNPPYLPVFSKEYRFDKLPGFSVEFRDDYKLKNVEYRLNFYNATKWVMINNGDINSKTYTGTWNLTQDDWEYMVENETYYMYFRLTDSLGNQNITPSANDAMKIIKDFNINKSTPYDPDLSDFKKWHWDNVFSVKVNVIDESNITSLQLYYSYSTDNKTWSEWKQYGNNITKNSSFIWNFAAKEGSGYYKFKTITWSTSGNMAVSKVKYTSITLFPMMQIIVMVPLAFILIIVTLFALGFKPFKIKNKKT